MPTTNEPKISFSTDKGLMYLIQQTTKQSTDTILMFFYDFGKEAFRIGVEAMSENQGSIRKEIHNLYPGTSIPFKVLIKADRYNHNKAFYHASLEISFPHKPNYVNQDKLLDAIVENHILGVQTMPDFEEPAMRTPKMYKDLIERVLDKKIKKKVKQ